MLVVNTVATPTELRKQLRFNHGKVFTVDATRIALDTIGRNIPNTPMIGALLKAIGVVSKEGAREEIGKRMEARVGKEIAQTNIKAFERAYNEVSEA